MSARRIVVVGASLAGLRAAEALRAQGFTGDLTIIGDEPHPPYDRPPLSKEALTGWCDPERTELPQERPLRADWLLGAAATRLDMAGRRVEIADGTRVEFDKLLIATGCRARPWPIVDQALLDGMHVLRGRDDARRLRAALDHRPRTVLVIGGGLIGSEIASVCRDLGLDVVVVQAAETPLHGMLGTRIGRFAADVQVDAGVDLRLNTTVDALLGDDTGHVRRARLSDGTELATDVVVVALGAISNVEWLAGSGLAADGTGLACDEHCRALTVDGRTADGVYAAGDVALWPHRIYDGRLVRLEHWGNAVAQARIAAHNMLHGESDPWVHQELPSFWSNQFGLNIKSVGLTSIADQVVVTQGSLGERKFVAAYGRQGRLVGAVAVDSPRALNGYAALIEARAPFPPTINATDGPAVLRPALTGFASH